MNFTMPEEVRSRERHVAQITALSIGVLAAGAIAYKKLKPEKSFDAGENYFDIIDNLDDCILEDAGLSISGRYAMMGGGASAALMHPETEIEFANRTVVPPIDIKKPQYREDTRTLADVDILVFSDNEAEIESVRAALTPSQKIMAEGKPEQCAYEMAKPGAKLKIGVTGLRPSSDYYKTPTSLAGKSLKLLMKDWVSHRLSMPDDSRAFAISDVKVELPDEYFEPWLLVLKSGNTIPILHPLIQVLCYPSRACHGIRPRDREKVTKIINNVGPQFGAHLVWDKKQQTANLVFDKKVQSGVLAAADFCDQKNALRWDNTKDRLGRAEAALLATRMAIHRQLDTREFFTQFGQGGWLFDNFVSRISGERQTNMEDTNG